MTRHVKIQLRQRSYSLTLASSFLFMICPLFVIYIRQRNVTTTESIYTRIYLFYKVVDEPVVTKNVKGKVHL
jgi:hypothetical protein